MKANKVILNNETLIDLTADTVIESDVAKGKTFHKANGEPAIGTASMSGGLSINGVIREYEVNAGASVSAGDFVEFVNKWGVGEFSVSTSGYLDACKLDDSRVLVAYRDNASSNNALNCVVLTMYGTSIMRGTEKLIATNGSKVSVSTLTDSKAILAYQWGSGNINSPRVSACVLEIEGDAITTVGTARSMGSDSYKSPRVIGLTEDKAMIIYHRYSTDGYVAVQTLHINGTTITVGGKATTSASTTVESVYASKMSNSKVIIAYRDTKEGVCSIIATVSDNGEIGIAVKKTITTLLPNSMALTALSDTKAVVVRDDGIAQVLTIGGSTSASIQEIVFREETASSMSVAALTNNKALISYLGSAQVLTIDNETITVGEEVVFETSTDGVTSGGTKTIVPLSPSSAMVVYIGNGASKYKTLTIKDTTVTDDALLGTSGTFIQPATSNLHNVGVARTSGAEGEIVEVYCVGSETV